jgi:hypothetical protein
VNRGSNPRGAAKPGDVVKWFNTEVCKTSIHRFESGRRLHLHPRRGQPDDPCHLGASDRQVTEQASRPSDRSRAVGVARILGPPGRARAPRRERNFVTDGVTNGLGCTRCRRQLPADAFRPEPRNTRRGRSSWCKSCSVDRNREWRAEHADEINARRRSRRTSDPETERAKARERYRLRQAKVNVYAGADAERVDPS